MKGSIAVATEQIGAARETVVIPASYAQQRLWFLDQLEGGAVYNVPVAHRLRGYLDVDALRSALTAVVERHEPLRTTFELIDGSPHQVISPPGPVQLELIDVSAEPGPEEQALRFVTEQAREPFDLASDRPLRAALIKLDEREHIFAMTLHHIVTDAWSMGVLMRELGAFYTASVQGRELALPELEIQYGDYAVWQQEWMQSGALQGQLEYWKRKLAGAPQLLELPLDKPRPAQQSFRGATRQRILPPELHLGVTGLSEQHGVTLFMVLLAAYVALLRRYSGQDDIVVATPVANRSRVELEPLVGLLVNTLALRTEFDGDPSFAEVLRRVRDTALEAFANQDLPFEKLVQELNPERDQSHPPVAQVLFVVQSGKRAPAGFAGLERELVATERATAKFDLGLFADPVAGGLRISIEYCTDLFERETIERMLEHFEALLASAISEPDAPVSSLKMLTESEREKVLDGFNQTPPVPGPLRCVPELVAEQARLAPDALAVVEGTGTLTYAELDCRAADLAGCLRGLGVGPDSVVAIVAERSIEMVSAVLAVLKAGGAYAPIDPSYPSERVEFMLADCGANVTLTQEHLLHQLPPYEGHVLCLDGDPATWPAGETSPAPDIEPEHLAYVIYTSGSTGKPKGVAMPHGPLANLIAWQLDSLPAPAAARTLQFASLSFDVAFQELFSTWCAGGTLVLVDERTRRDTPALLGVIADHAVERLFLPFVALQSLCEAAERVSAHFPALREVITAGEQLKVTSAVRRFFARHPSCTLTNQYGPSESHVVSSYQLRGPAADWPRLPPIGRPIAGARIYLLDQRRNPVPIGLPGELYIGGAALARGYLGRPELDRERFVNDPFSARAGARMYRTGDLARYSSDGNVTFLGRADDQVKIRGFRVELGEIETILAQHPAVAEAAAVLTEGTSGERRLFAYIVPRAGREIDPGELLAHARGRVPEYMVPQQVVVLEALPLTPSGKLDRRALPSRNGRPAPDTPVALPGTELERSLAEIWKRLLHLEQIGLDDDFFDLGGHSLLAVQLVHAIEDELGRVCSLPMLFRNGTLRRLAAELQVGGIDTTEPTILQLGHGNGPEVFCICGIHLYQELAEELAPDFCLYGMFLPIEQELFKAGSWRRAQGGMSVPEIAARYVATLREHQPTGPYLLIGFCFGGVLAYEVAQQLRAQGEEVKLLAMLDSTLRSLMHRPPPKLSIRLKQRALGAFELLAPVDLQRRLLGEEWVNETKRLERIRTRIYGRAMRRYEVRPYGGPAVLGKPERSAKAYGGTATDRTWGWGPYIPDLEVIEVPGAHQTHLRRPHVRAVARGLRETLGAHHNLGPPGELVP